MARPQYRGAHPAMSKAIRSAHVAAYGFMCPGVPGLTELHPSRDLTASHVETRRPELGYEGALCRSCNSKRRRLLGV